MEAEVLSDRWDAPFNVRHRALMFESQSSPVMKWLTALRLE